MDKLIITVAGVGAETTKEAQPALPVSAAEIGADAARCREAGASHVPPARARRRRQPDAGTRGVRGGHRRDPQAHRHHHPDLDRRRHGHDGRRAPAAARAQARDGLADDRHGELRRRRVLQRHGADERVLPAPEGRRACVPSSRSSRPARSTTRSSWSRSSVRPDRLLHWDFVLGVPGSHERRAAQPRLPGRPAARRLDLDLHRHRPLAHAGHDDGARAGRQRAPRLRGQRLLPQGRAGRRATPSSWRAWRASRRSGTGTVPLPTRRAASSSCRRTTSRSGAGRDDRRRRRLRERAGSPAPPAPAPFQTRLPLALPPPPGSTARPSTDPATECRT